MLRSALVAFEFLKERGFVVSDEVKDSEDLQVWTSGSVSIRFIGGDCWQRHNNHESKHNPCRFHKSSFQHSPKHCHPDQLG